VIKEDEGFSKDAAKKTGRLVNVYATELEIVETAESESFELLVCNQSQQLYLKSAELKRIGSENTVGGE
jgi:hypothetical protein